VRFAPEEARQGVEVPNRAIQLTNEGERYVWVVNDNVAERRKVAIADLSRTGVIVSEGLKEGDLVVTDGMSKITNGSLVEIER
jgi:multidrug efflux pump subunit AcrA (membrane-fusion protein)